MLHEPKLFARPGDRYGRFSVIERDAGPPRGWLCRCDCGTVKTVGTYNLTHGEILSCGCYDRERRLGASHPQFKHGLSGAAIYGVWKEMLRRCRSPRCAGFPRYGGRGIKVCERWLGFANFYADMGPSYLRGLTLEREDNDGDYQPGNCSWIPLDRQAVNRQATPYVEFRGKRLAFSDAWRAAGMVTSLGAAWSRYHTSGWDLERALTAPSNGRPPRRPEGFCLNGHALTPENTRVDGNGKRHCRPCNRAAVAAYKARRVAA